MSSLIRPNVLRMRAYSPGKPIEELRRELGLSQIVKLASNENPWGPSPVAVRAIEEAVSDLHRYPDGAAHELRSAISSHFRIPLNQIVVGNGSDELIHMLGLVLINSEEDEIVAGHPSFVQYAAVANLAPCKLVQVPLDANETHDLRAMASAVTPRTKMVFVANPNNPTGTIVGRAELEWFIKQLPDTCVLVLDEAYFEFASASSSDYAGATEFLATEKVVSLRTFSKAYGLAGIRVGYGFFPAWLADGVERIRAPFNVNNLAQVAGAAALKDTAHLSKTLEGTRKALDRLSAIFKRVGAKATPSFANFVWADIGRPARPVFQSLLESGVIVRPGDVLGNPNALRVSVGTEAELDAFEKAFLGVIAEAAVR
jgi:histidinol-phosphate aminotransferase